MGKIHALRTMLTELAVRVECANRRSNSRALLKHEMFWQFYAMMTRYVTYKPSDPHFDSSIITLQQVNSTYKKPAEQGLI